MADVFPKMVYQGQMLENRDNWILCCLALKKDASILQLLLSFQAEVAERARIR